MVPKPTEARIEDFKDGLGLGEGLVGHGFRRPSLLKLWIRRHCTAIRTLGQLHRPQQRPAGSRPEDYPSCNPDCGWHGAKVDS